MPRGSGATKANVAGVVFGALGYQYPMCADDVMLPSACLTQVPTSAHVGTQLYVRRASQHHLIACEMNFIVDRSGGTRGRRYESAL